MSFPCHGPNCKYVDRDDFECHCHDQQKIHKNETKLTDSDKIKAIREILDGADTNPGYGFSRKFRLEDAMNVLIRIDCIIEDS